MNYSSSAIRKKLDGINSHKTRMGTTVLIYIFKGFVLCFLFGTVALFCMGAGSFNAIIENAPHITLNDVTPSQYKTTVYDANGDAIETLVASGANRIYATIDEIPECLQHAFIAIEDERFYEHNGIDARGIMRAAYIGISSGFNFTQGASTLTQQLIKNSVFAVENENSLSDRLKRKIQEQYLAVNLEKDVDNKKLILENYLNTINLGNNNLGVQSAARNYFNKDVSELTISESAVIAAITQNPSYYNPIRYPDHNKNRRALVLNNMLNQGYITSDELNTALADDVYSRIENVHSSQTSSVYSYYTDALIPEIMEDLMTQKGYSYTQAYNLVYRGGLSIYSCEDSKLQKFAEDMINNQETWYNEIEYSLTFRFKIKDKSDTLSSYTESGLLDYIHRKYDNSHELLFKSVEEADKYCDEYKEFVLAETEGELVAGSEKRTYTPQPQLSFVLTESETGMVRAIVGGRGNKEESMVLNRATTSLRQPGSSIKPLVVYGPAVDTGGYNISSVVDDVPFFYDNGQLVQNDDKLYKGFVTIRQAIAESRNIPALKILKDIGLNTGINYLKNFGISTLTDNDYYLPIALGTCSVTNFEMTAAYAALANKGQYIKPKLYTKVEDHDGNIILDNTAPVTKQVLKESTAFLISNAMHTVTTNGTLAGLFPDDVYACAKSGTTQNAYDKWVIGSAGKYTAGVWTGYDKNKSYNLDNYNWPYPYIKVWRDVLLEANKDNDCSAPAIPSGIVNARICKDSGLLAVEGVCDHDPRGNRIITEYFAQGQVPTEACNSHIKVSICKDTGLVAGDKCTGAKEFEIRLLKDIDYDTDKFKVEDNYLAITESDLEHKCNK